MPTETDMGDFVNNHHGALLWTQGRMVGPSSLQTGYDSADLCHPTSPKRKKRDWIIKIENCQKNRDHENKFTSSEYMDQLSAGT